MCLLKIEKQGEIQVCSLSCRWSVCDWYLFLSKSMITQITTFSHVWLSVLEHSIQALKSGYPKCATGLLKHTIYEATGEKKKTFKNISYM